MKRIKFLIALFCFSMLSHAQDNNISLHVHTFAQHEDIPVASLEYLKNSLCNAASIDGMSAQNEYLTSFLLIPKVSIATKNVLATTQQQVVLTLDVSLQVVDNVSGTIYSATNVNLKGVGANETKAFNSAFRSISKSNSQVSKFLAEAKDKIMAYYEAEGKNIIKRASLLASQEKYPEAFYVLSMIPMQCSHYDAAISASMEIWPKYKNYSCAGNLAKAQAAWVANPNVQGANLAATYLSEIFQDAGCYPESQQLYKEIKSKLGEQWNFSMKVYDKETDLRQAQIDAIREIGVAYAKGQQPKVVINNSKYE